ncbi:peptidoglycan DD-metalloendopeptidase family protein [Streptomyces sp. SID8379]|uniref:M23 family metallopeptidase n=1 Tax=unclassified Streptomyces TaxID=2593676 RepID=UPI000364775F|nr:M23 family metallopeptidase [Streptomyces sp. HmicA12]MYW63757.1 peptidoglycan DD-metalloendopeptidase family protein [Streptomyces sp. SID8379]
MASNRPAPEFSYPSNDEFGPDQETWEEWNPTEESVRPVRGRHRVARQRGGLARSSTVLGVGVIAAVGAGGIATAQGGKPAVHISMPDLPGLSSVKDSLPEATSLPGVGALISDDSGSDTATASAAPLTTVGNGTSDAGEALRTRILAQAETQQDAADASAQQAAQDAAAKKAAEEAAAKQDAAEKKEAAAKKKAEEEAKKKAEAERLAELAKSYKLPVASYTVTGTFGQPGAMWSSGYHTGLDFAASTGTPIYAIHSGTVTEAGWAGAYGYRTIITLDDGTELWFCHQSSLNVSAGQKVSTGDVIGRVGATGNVTGPHLHLEVHPGGDATGIDPAAWLRGKGLTP